MYLWNLDTIPILWISSAFAVLGSDIYKNLLSLENLAKLKNQIIVQDGITSPNIYIFSINAYKQWHVFIYLIFHSRKNTISSSNKVIFKSFNNNLMKPWSLSSQLKTYKLYINPCWDRVYYIDRQLKIKNSYVYLHLAWFITRFRFSIRRFARTYLLCNNGS